MLDDILLHYGVKGQRWGVRRYVDKSGKLTREGLLRQRTENAAKTMDDVNSIINSMSDKDKKLLNLSTDTYLTKEEGRFVVKRFMSYYKDIPVTFFDLLRDGDNLEVALGTRSDYRGKGFALKTAKKGMDWCEKNRDKFDMVRWSAKKENIPSSKLAEKLNFTFDEKLSNEEWNQYIYK